MLISPVYSTPGMFGNPTISRGSGMVSDPSARRGTRLAGGSAPVVTHSSSATSSARSPALATSGFRGCRQMPSPLEPMPAACGRLENR